MNARTLFHFSVRASLLVLSLTSISALATTAVWKVSKGEDYLYLGGTAHLLPESAFPLPVEFEFAYQQTDKLILETTFPDQADKQFQQSMLAAFRYQDSTTLEQLLSKDVYQGLTQYFAGFGIPIEQLSVFRPGFIVAQLTVLAAMQANMAGMGVDHYFADKAKKDGRATAYLETLDLQLRLLAGLGEGYEDDFLRYQLEQSQQFAALYKKMLSAWRSGDLDTLNELVIEPVKAADPQTYKTLYVQRNQNWLPKIEQLFGNEYHELVLVGAGHLAGEDSLLVLLAQAGYQLEQIHLDEEGIHARTHRH